MTRHRVCSLSDIPDDEPFRVTAGETPICIAKCDGEILAINDVCSHADVSLSEGDLEGCEVECWLHGSRFDLRTGKPTGLPATKAVPTYRVTIEGDDVLVDVEK